MRGMHTVPFTSVAVVAQQDLFEFVCPAAAAVEIHEISLSQSTELGDAAEESLSIILKSGQTVSGSGGSSATPNPTETGGAAAGTVVEVNNTTKANTGTILTHFPWNWNIRVPFEKIFTPEARPVFAPGRRCTLELASTPADSITMSGYIVFREIG